MRHWATVFELSLSPLELTARCARFLSSTYMRCFLLFLAGLLAAGPVVGAAVTSKSPTTLSRFVNPLPLPNYPVGRLVRDVSPGKINEPLGLWLVERKIARLAIYAHHFRPA